MNLSTQDFIGGRWVAAQDGRAFAVIDPATLETIEQVKYLCQGGLR